MGLERSAVSAYALTFSKLVSMVYLMVDDPSRERFAVDRVKQAVNEAMLDIALDVQLIKETAIIELKTGNIVYGVDTFADNQSKRDYACPLRVVYNDANNPALQTVSKQELDTDPYFNWSVPARSTNYYPFKWHSDVFEHGEIGIWPPPNSDGESAPSLVGNLQVTYVAYPNPMVNDDDTPDILSAMYHEAIATRAAEIMLNEGGEDDLVLAESMDNDAMSWTAKIVGDQYRNMTHYNDVSPM
jgi:hypothetical protein